MGTVVAILISAEHAIDDPIDRADPEASGGLGGSWLGSTSDTAVGAGAKILTVLIKKANERRRGRHIATMVAQADGIPVLLRFVKSRIGLRKAV